ERRPDRIDGKLLRHRLRIEHADGLFGPDAVDRQSARRVEHEIERRAVTQPFSGRGNGALLRQVETVVAARQRLDAAGAGLVPQQIRRGRTNPAARADDQGPVSSWQRLHPSPLALPARLDRRRGRGRLTGLFMTLYEALRPPVQAHDL